MEGGGNMITETIIGIFISFASILIDGLPSVDIGQTFQTFDIFLDYVDVAAYFVPVNTVTAILRVIIAEELFKIGISIVKLILKFIPFMGG